MVGSSNSCALFFDSTSDYLGNLRNYFCVLNSGRKH